MTRRQALALSLAGVAIAPGGAIAIAQQSLGYPKAPLPTRDTLARLGLERSWYAAVPLGAKGEHVLSMNLAGDMVFVQTDIANLHAYHAETGKYLWGTDLGRPSPDAQPVSVNSDMAFVTNGPQLYALDKRTGRTNWVARMEGSAIGATAATEELAMVGLAKGSLVAFNVRDRTKANPPGRSAGTFAWTWQTRASITARPLPASKVVAFASQDSRVYVAQLDPHVVLHRFLTGGPIVGSLAALGTRTVIAPSTDGSLYALDLFTGDSRWIMSTGSRFEQEPFVDRETVYAINHAGRMIAVDGKTGTLLWSEGTGGGKILAIGATRVYVISKDRDLSIVDRATGKVLASPRETKDRAGLNLREYDYSYSNDQNDRLYFATKSGFLLCLHDTGQMEPRPLRAPDSKPFGYLPPDGEPRIATPPPEEAEKPAEETEKP